MLVFDFVTIGNKLYTVRKKLGMTQAEVAEAAGLSDRAYADIERGSVNMRMESVLRICHALHITPNDLFVEENDALMQKHSSVLERLSTCPIKKKETALKLLEIYLDAEE